jgi:hypothetical protein
MILFIILGILMVALDIILGTLMAGWDGVTTLGTHTEALVGDIILGEAIGVGEAVVTTIVGVAI